MGYWKRSIPEPKEGFLGCENGPSLSPWQTEPITASACRGSQGLHQQSQS